MSLSQVTPSIAVHFPPGELIPGSAIFARSYPELPCKRDATTKAVLRYLKSSADQADAFDHLTAICWRATRPHFLRDRLGYSTVKGIPQFSDISGRRTGRTSRQEGKAHDVTREWIQEWLLSFLVSYRGKSWTEVVGAADAGKFRYLGRLCRLRLKSIVCRRLESGYYSCPELVSLDEPVGEGPTTWGDYLDHIPSLPTRVSIEHFRAVVADAMKIVDANIERLAGCDLLSGLRAHLANAEHISDLRDYDRLVTQTIAELRGVSVQAARAYRRKFLRAMYEQIRAGHRIVGDILSALGEGSKYFDAAFRELNSVRNKDV